MSKEVSSIHDLQTKAGYHPIYIAPLSGFRFFEDLIEYYKDEVGQSLHSKKITFPFSLSPELTNQQAASELLVIELSHVESFKKWLTSYRLIDSEKKDYHVVNLVSVPIYDPIMRAGKKVLNNEMDALTALTVASYSSNIGILSAIQPKTLTPLPTTVSFRKDKPDPYVLKEAEAYFKTAK